MIAGQNFASKPDPASGARWICCRDCALIQPLAPPRPKMDRICRRCGASFGTGRQHHHRRLIALAVTAIILFALANIYPLVGVEVEGQSQTAKILSDAAGFSNHGIAPVALFVIALAIAMPLGQILIWNYVFHKLNHGRKSLWLGMLLRFSGILSEWSMLDVLLVSCLIAITRIRSMAEVDIGTGLWALAFLVFCMAACESSFDLPTLWDELKPSPRFIEAPDPAEWMTCPACSLLQKRKFYVLKARRSPGRCIRCDEILHERKPASIERTWALVIAGFLFYIPANVYPVMTVTYFGRGSPKTIIGGIIELFQSSDWPLGIIVLVASVIVPLMKLLGLSFLLLSARAGVVLQPSGHTRLYRLILMIGRWSTVDIFVTGLLTALLTFGNIATVIPGTGALAFSTVVLVTMLAAGSFDSRLLWDKANHA